MVIVSYLVHYGTSLQNVTDIVTKCDVYYKWWFINLCIAGKVLFYKVASFYLKSFQFLCVPYNPVKIVRHCRPISW